MNITEDGLIKKQIIKEGIGQQAQKYQEIQAYLMVFDNEKNLLFGSNKCAIKFELNNRKVFKGLEISLQSMKLGERCEIQCDKQYFDEQKDVIMEIEIVQMGQIFDNLWDYSLEDRLECSRQFKESGNTQLKQQNLSEAQGLYNNGLKLIQNDTSQQFEVIKLQILSNLSLVYLKQQNYSQVLESTTQAIKLDQNNCKLLYRRGAAYTELKQFQLAKNDINKAIILEPSNSTLIQQLKTIKEAEQKVKQKEKNLYAKMLNQ